MKEQPFDHNDECRYCDEQAMHRGDCPWLVALVAEVEQLQLDQRMLATTVRNTVLALGDVGNDWTGTVTDGIALINMNVDRVNAEIKRLHETLNQTVMVHMREMRAAYEQIDRLEAELVTTNMKIQALRELTEVAVVSTLMLCGGRKEEHDLTHPNNGLTCPEQQPDLNKGI